MGSIRQSILAIAWMEFVPALLIVLNSLVWYTLIYAVFSEAVNGLSLPATETITIFAANYVGVACSAVLGAKFLPRMHIDGFSFWVLLGSISTVTLMSIPNNGLAINVLIALLLGISVGLGLPSTMACFADSTRTETRGTQGGITWVLVGLVSFFIALGMNALDIFPMLIVLALWRIWGLLVLPFLGQHRTPKTTGKAPSYSYVLHRKDVLLYLVPWIMFSLVNFCEMPILENFFGGFYGSVEFIVFGLSGVFAVFGGLLADVVGRKRVVITGFIMTGIEYTVLSLLSDMPISWYLYTALDGISWGMFAAVFFMTVWGDLAEEQQKEKYYALGGLPYLLAGFLSIVIKPYVGMIPTATTFSLASFFLFLAVLPLMYAPETLPEKSIRERELKDYVERAKKVKGKYV